MKKIFIAHSLGLSMMVLPYVWELEKKGYKVFFPSRDAPQNASEPAILKANLDAIRDCDEVHVFWDGSSHGTMFDLGSAYALGKPIIIMHTPNHHWLKFMDKNIKGYLPLMGIKY